MAEPPVGAPNPVAMGPPLGMLGRHQTNAPRAQHPPSQGPAAMGAHPQRAPASSSSAPQGGESTQFPGQVTSQGPYGGIAPGVLPPGLNIQPKLFLDSTTPGAQAATNKHGQQQSHGRVHAGQPFFGGGPFFAPGPQSHYPNLHGPSAFRPVPPNLQMAHPDAAASSGQGSVPSGYPTVSAPMTQAPQQQSQQQSQGTQPLLQQQQTQPLQNSDFLSTQAPQTSSFPTQHLPSYPALQIPLTGPPLSYYPPTSQQMQQPQHMLQTAAPPMMVYHNPNAAYSQLGVPQGHPSHMPYPYQQSMMPPLQQQQSGLVQQFSGMSMGSSLPPPGGAPYYEAQVQRTARPLSSQTAEIELAIRCKGLRDMDVVGKSDPMAVVYRPNPSYRPGAGRQMDRHNTVPVPVAGGSPYGDPRRAAEKWEEVGRTEILKNNLNPEFSRHIKVDYFFEERQVVRVALWDVDSKSDSITKNYHDFLGEVVTTLGEIVSSGVFEADLTSPHRGDNVKLLGGKRNLGKIFIRAHERRQEDAKRITLRLSAQNLDRKDFGGLGKSDPYYIVSRVIGDGEGGKTKLYTSEYIPRNLNPHWKEAKFPMRWPKGGTVEDVRLEITVFDKDRLNRDDLIGVAKTTVHELETARTLPVINEKKKRRRGRRYVNSGTLVVQKFKIVPVPSFFEYLQGGLQLHFTVAVDFTLSNGDPANPQSLHHINQYGQNQYTQAIEAVGSLLAPYSRDNKFAALGFGAELPPRNQVSFKFSLSGSEDPHVIGVQGILEAYKRCLSSVTMSGPTNFSPVIQHSIELTRSRPATHSEQHYDVLLIITDGVITDFTKTIDAIIEASSLAMSIIIVGVGNQNFEKMRILDGDNKELTSQDGKRKVKRDIVQFVDFKRLRGGSPERLASHLLAELPDNVVSHFFGMDVRPNEPRV